MRISKEELEEMLEDYGENPYYAHHDKGEKAETDVPRLIAYIRELEKEIELANKLLVEKETRQ